jgi:hypothetical protein
MNLDYSPLQRTVTKSEIEAFRATHKIKLMSTRTISIVAAITLITMVVVSVVGGEIVYGTSALAVFLTLSIFIVPVAIIVAIIMVVNRDRIKKIIKMDSFAQKNSLGFGFNRRNVAYTGIIFGHGSDKRIYESYAFQDGKEIGNYSYTVGSGRNRRAYNWGYIRIKLVRKLPHMLLDAKKNNILGRFTNLPVSFHGNETMDLEGNFAEHFTLYVPKGYQKDALYVFTPDVMLAMIDHGAQYDMEVVDDYLYIYSPSFFKLDDASALQSILEVTGKIGAELIEQGDYYADERVGDRALNQIAPTGRRLRSGVGLATIIFTIVIILIFLLT